MEQNNKDFPNGMIIKAPRDGAPDFVKGSISVKKQEFYEWMKTQPAGDWINLDIKVSKAGKWYLSVNDWKPNQQGQSFSNNSQQPQQAPQGFDSIDASFDNPNSNGIPF